MIAIYFPNPSESPNGKRRLRLGWKLRETGELGELGLFHSHRHLIEPEQFGQFLALGAIFAADTEQERAIVRSVADARGAEIVRPMLALHLTMQKLHMARL